MRKLFFIAAIAILFAACSSSPSTNTPKGVVNAFIEASKKYSVYDANEMKKYVTSTDVTMLEFGQNIMNRMDSAKKNIMQQQINMAKERFKDIKYEIGNEKINGDNATVDVTSIVEGKPITQPFSLKKENGEWKIALMSTGMKSFGTFEDKLNENLDSSLNKEIKIRPGMKDSLMKIIDKVKGMSTDSIEKMVNKVSEEINH